MTVENQLSKVAVTIEDAYAVQPELIRIRRKLHQHPELGFELEQTVTLISDFLNAHSIPHKNDVGGSGIVALIEGDLPGPVVGLRADMDALPIEEQNEVDYASQTKGMMHACGHDLHTSCLLGAARLLSPLRSQIHGSIKLIFQPAEETDAGAAAMLADGVLDNPGVEAIFGLHNYPGLPTGCIAVRNGPLMSSVDIFRILIEGKSGHGAVPDKAVDALLAAASVVLQLQTIVSRNISPFKEAVVTVGRFQAGTADNIIAETAELLGTARTLDPEIRELLPKKIQSIVENGSRALGAAGFLNYKKAIPVLVNDETAAELVRQAAYKLLGNQSVLLAEPTMGGDDFALMLEQVPGCYFWLGATPPHSSPRLWHTPSFDVDENAIPVGSAVLAQSALNYLQSKLQSES